MAISETNTDPDVTWVSGSGCPLVVHYWADLQSVHVLRCYGNITQTRNVSEYMLVLALCLVIVVSAIWHLLLQHLLPTRKAAFTPHHLK